MNNEVLTINADNYEAMAKAMGISGESGSSSKPKNVLPILQIHREPLVKDGKMHKGFFKIRKEGEDNYHYAQTVVIRPFLQRFKYKKWSNETSSFSNSIIADNFNIDLKDELGTFNLGKNSGYIDKETYSNLPEQTKTLYKSIKRTRVILGTVSFVNAIDENGKPTKIKDMPFRWDIDNAESFKNMGMPFKALLNAKRLTMQHEITVSLEERKGVGSYFVAVPSIDLTKSLEIRNPEDHDIFNSFQEWIQNFNAYIMNLWDENCSKHEVIDEEVIEDFIEIDTNSKEVN